MTSIATHPRPLREKSRLQHQVEAAFEAHDACWLLASLRNTSTEFYLVGGAVRDGYLGALPKDLDIAVPNGNREAHRLLRDVAEGTRNRHGNWRFDFPCGSHVDLLEPKNFYRRFTSLEPMLRFFDASVNAAAINLRSGQLVDPLGGIDDLRLGRVTLPVERWTSMDDFESVHLTLRMLRLLRRHPLWITNATLLAEQLPKFDRVMWHGLYELNGLERQEAKELVAQTYAASCSAFVGPRSPELQGRTSLK